MSRITQFAFGGQPVVSIVTVLAPAIAVHLERTPGDVAFGHTGQDRPAIGDSTDGIVSTLSVLCLAGFAIMQPPQCLDNRSRRCGTPTPVRTGGARPAQTPTA
jgi:hypothetical protein